MPRRYVFAKSQMTVTDRLGNQKRFQPGEAVDAESELVKAHPDAFAEDPPHIWTDQGRVSSGVWVETATAAPGEKRNTKRA